MSVDGAGNWGSGEEDCASCKGHKALEKWKGVGTSEWLSLPQRLLCRPPTSKGCSETVCSPVEGGTGGEFC